MIIITGNPVDGFTYYGPFESADEAIPWAEASLPSRDWWGAPLYSPEARE